MQNYINGIAIAIIRRRVVYPKEGCKEGTDGILTKKKKNMKKEKKKKT